MKRLLPKHEGLSVVFRTHIKKLVWWHALVRPVSESRDGQTAELHDEPQASLLGKLLAG